MEPTPFLVEVSEAAMRRERQKARELRRASGGSASWRAEFATIVLASSRRRS